MKRMPQEIEVWHVLPAIRRELASSLIKDCGYTQKQAARTLEITEAAISQYLSHKRAAKVSFDKRVLKEIKLSAKSVAAGTPVIGEMQRLTDLPAVRELVCAMHKKEDHLPADCALCSYTAKKKLLRIS